MITRESTRRRRPCATQALAKHVNELVGRINGVYGTLEYSPIHYINQSIPQDELIAIYHLADACLVTSVRDGMNLVSHEYVAAQESLDQNDDSIEETRPRSRASSSKDDDDVLQPFVKEGPGALVLSEFAGSAQSLSGAIRVNPWNTDELARAIHDA
jgi:trehalose-6-phosphate synthase